VFGASAPPPIDWAGPVRRLGWEEFLVVLSPGDLLASRRKLPLVELKDLDWVMFEPGNGLWAKPPRGALVVP
jgi:DNA-binding transcriptional LysR family regulator